MSFRSVFVFAVFAACSVPVPAEVRHEPIAVVALTSTLDSQATTSTNLLPFELSAVRLRPEPGNRSTVQ